MIFFKNWVPIMFSFRFWIFCFPKIQNQNLNHYFKNIVDSDLLESYSYFESKQHLRIKVEDWLKLSANQMDLMTPG